MRKTRWLILLLWILLPFSGGSQTSLAEIRVSDILEKGSVQLYDPLYLVYPEKSKYDTVRTSFILNNDTEHDTTLYLYEGLNDWVHIRLAAIPDTVPAYESVSGREWYGRIPYDFVYFPGRAFPVLKGMQYLCEVNYIGTASQQSYDHVYLLSPESYKANLSGQRDFEKVNNVVTYFFIGALTFGFFFFFFLFIKSRYRLFGLYALFLFLQVLYGIIQVDVYTGAGSFMMSRFNWDDYVNEILVFLAQAVYVHFMSLWLGVKESNQNVYRFLNAIAIFFLCYAISVYFVYTLDRHAGIVLTLNKGVRLASVMIQLLLFYVLIFKVKSPVKGYVLAGTCLMIIFGVGFVAMNLANVFNGTQLEYFDNGSWYMIGILCECMCFASGLGLRYFLIDQANLRLQKENIKALEDKLSTEQIARENERKLSELNQELTNQQLTALRAQMNPHFIFNALNSIQKYIVTGSVDEANSYLSKFSKLQRMILSYSDENFISLDKELDILKLYLELEQLRLTNEFHFDIIVDEDIEPEEIKIPPMMLQPFAENAIWHGLIPKAGEKKLRIEFYMKNQDTLICTVEDNGVGREAAQKMKEQKLMNSAENKSKGMSLVYNRLAILERKYGSGFSVRVTDKVNAKGGSEGTLVELTIPLTG